MPWNAPAPPRAPDGRSRRTSGRGGRAGRAPTGVRVEHAGRGSELPLDPGGGPAAALRARTADELLFRGGLDDLAARRGARAVYLLGADREPLSAAGLRRLVPDLAERDVYLCGSPGLTAAVRRSLHEAGLPPGQLHEERFAF